MVKSRRWYNSILSFLVIFSLLSSLLSINTYAVLINNIGNSLSSQEISVEDGIQQDNIGAVSVANNTVINNASRSTYSINWTIAANSMSTSSTASSLVSGDNFYVNISYTPVSSTQTVQIGMVNTSTNTFTCVNCTSGSLTRFFNITQNSTYKLRIKNNTSSAITVTGTYVPISYTSSLAVPLIAQQQTNWCWAACLQMSAITLGYPTTQTDIVIAVKGSAVNETGSDSDFADGMEYATNDNYTTTASRSTITISSMSTNLNNSKPIIIVWGNYNSTGTIESAHANVLTAVDTNNNFVKMQDPANGGSTKKYKYSDLTSNPLHKYYKTILISNI